MQDSLNDLLGCRELSIVEEVRHVIGLIEFKFTLLFVEHLDMYVLRHRFSSHFFDL